jgi:hypothetical protein
MALSHWQVLHGNLASVKLDASALSIINEAYAYVGCQGERVNKAFAFQVQKKRRSTVRKARVAPSPSVAATDSRLGHDLPHARSH